MKKSIYSLALSENVIRAVDEAAYKCGMSRSAIINRILAEKLECDTPEMRMEEISDSMEAILGDIVQVERQRSAMLLVVKSVLEYKYRPTISYKLELERVRVYRHSEGRDKDSKRTAYRPFQQLFPLLDKVREGEVCADGQGLSCLRAELRQVFAQTV